MDMAKRGKCMKKSPQNQKLRVAEKASKRRKK